MDEFTKGKNSLKTKKDRSFGGQTILLQSKQQNVNDMVNNSKYYPELEDKNNSSCPYCLSREVLGKQDPSQSPPCKNTSVEMQRLAALAYLHEICPLSTLYADEEMEVPYPDARVRKLILEHCLSGCSITLSFAEEVYGIKNLTRIIGDLREEGWEVVEREIVEFDGPSEERITTQYSLSTI